MSKLTPEEYDFLSRLRHGRSLKHADRAEDLVRQRCRKRGLAAVEQGPRRWVLTDAGRAALSKGDGHVS